MYCKIATFIVVFLAITAISSCIKESDGSAPDRNLPVISVSDISIEEGDIDETYSVVLTLTGEQKTNAVFKFSAVNETAESGIDFELEPVNGGNQLVFAPGETEKTLKLKIFGDELNEGKERFSIKLYNPINVEFAKDQIDVLINDDDNNVANLVLPTSGFSTPLLYPGYNLVWADEFEADTLNLQNWTFETGAGGWGNQEWQFYRDDNTSLVDGNLVITAKKQKFGGSDYTSSRIVTKGKKQFKFGRIDIRAALPKGQGLWPALWMLGSNIDAVSWPACGEIDIMELAGHIPNRTVSTVHYGADVAQHQYKSLEKYLTGTDNFQDEYHVFSLNWEADLIQFLVDDEVVHTITPASLGGATYPFNKNFFFIFNVAIGGTFSGYPDNSTAFPQYMVVDYIRVFQK